MRTASLGRVLIVVEQAPDVGITGRVDVDRKGRQRGRSDDFKRIVDDRRIDFGCFLLFWDVLGDCSIVSVFRRRELALSGRAFAARRGRLAF